MANNGLAGLWRELGRQEYELSRGDGAHTGGPRRFDSFGRSVDLLRGSDPWGSQQTSRVQRVRDALRLSGQQAKEMIARSLAGIDLSTIWDILIAAVEDIALYYGASVVVGAGIGALGGAFLGGAGAVPGAVAGATVGASVGGWVLALLGLKSLVDGLVADIPAALRCYEQGFQEAWGTTHWDRQRVGVYSPQPINADPSRAAWHFANGHVLIITSLLSVMVAYLTRGRGDKAMMMQEVRQSTRLGPKVADWLEQNEEKLRNHPQLKPRDRRGATAPPEEPLPPARKDKPRQEPEKPKVMEQKKVPCFKPNDLPQGSFPEFDRQLSGQEAGLNEMTVDEYLKGRDAFDNKETVRNPQVARKARTDYQKEITEKLAEKLSQEGLLSPREAESKATEMAAEKMTTLAALHNPDMVAAGKDVISDFGDSNINSRIGAQWRSRVGALDEAAQKVPEAARGSVKMNAKLVRC